MDRKNNKWVRKKRIVFSFLISAGSFLIGLSWLSDYQKYGYYNFHPGIVPVQGKQGPSAIYVLLFWGLFFMIYGIYLTIRLFRSK